MLNRCEKLPKENIKHRLKLLLFSFAFVICGWLISSCDVHAAGATISGGYLYVSSGTCLYVEGYGVRWSHYGGADYNDYYWEHTTFVKVSSPEVVGSQIRWKITGGTYRWMDESSGNYSYRYESWTPPTSGSSDVSSYYDGHSWGGVSIAATCTVASGRKCTRCGAIQRVGNPLGHDYTIKQKDATCTANQINKCNRCTSTSQVANTALGHDWDSGVPTPDATPYATGIMTYTCQRDCSHQRTEVIPQKHFNVYSGNSRINKIYIGSTLVMDANAGINTLVK